MDMDGRSCLVLRNNNHSLALVPRPLADGALEEGREGGRWSVSRWENIVLRVQFAWKTKALFHSVQISDNAERQLGRWRTAKCLLRKTIRCTWELHVLADRGGGGQSAGGCRGISSRGLRRVFLITYYCCYYGWSLFASLGTGQNGYIVFRRPVAVNKEPATVEEDEEEGEGEEEEKHKQRRSRSRGGLKRAETKRSVSRFLVLSTC